MLGDWGVDEPSRDGPWPTAATGPSGLPAVVAAGQEGFSLAPEAALWCFLPAVWPPSERAWVEDRAARYVTVHTRRSASQVPWSRWDFAAAEQDVRQLLAASGVPPRPPGRLWMLRPPPVFDTLDETLEAIVERAEAAGVPVMCSQPFVAATAVALRDWFGR